MTTDDLVKIKCALCKKTSTHIVILSSNTLSSPDLDTRPSEMMRSTMRHWVQKCPSCGYCSSNISEKAKNTLKVVQSELYKNQLNDDNFPELANRFLCSSLISQNISEYAEAGWDCVKAAWVCDDENNNDSAKKCRLKAVALFNKAKEHDQEFSQSEGLLIADLLRRSGEFYLARDYCKEELEKETDETLLKIIKFEKMLIDNYDSACHTIDEALKEDS